MKSIRPIVLKDAKVLSIEEMKHLFGGSGGSGSSTVSATCSIDAACTVNINNAAVSGTCIATTTTTGITCGCTISVNGHPMVFGDSACLKIVVS